VADRFDANSVITVCLC